LNIVKDALALFKCREADKEWIVKKKSNNYRKIKAWDEDNFEMSSLNIKIRFIKFIEEIHAGDKVEIKEAWIITTDKFTSVETLWKIMHRRWDIENNAFHQLKTEWHLDHCFLHGPTGVEVVLMFIIIAFNLMQLYFFRCMRGFREKNVLQIDIIEDIRDERFTIENN
ncbi:transposase, partial [Clostridium sp. LCP25S3_F8]